MPGERDPNAHVHEQKPPGVLGERIRLIFDWYKGMVDESTGRLLYMYDPESGATIGDGLKPTLTCVAKCLELRDEIAGACSEGLERYSEADAALLIALDEAGLL